MARYERILVPTDGSEPSETATEHAVDLAERYGATVDALFVVDETYPAVSHWDMVVEAEEATGERALDAVAEAGEAAGVAVERHLRRGVPYEVIVDAAGDYGADLIVMGTNGRTGLSRIASTGSTTERVVRLTTVPTLVVGGARAESRG
ncbi:universal stress protein [Halosimplex salinum]|uniref:universal stress protein n=1 Tax=Halosimplex salinum TaxID=1710538 RepID=UPI000F488143|nr:universal stress protein [Halosimplex salinum]